MLKGFDRYSDGFEIGWNLYRELPRLSADDLAARANLLRQEAQRRAFRKENLELLAEHHDRSVFYQIDLRDVAQKICDKQSCASPLRFRKTLL